MFLNIKKNIFINKLFYKKHNLYELLIICINYIKYFEKNINTLKYYDILNDINNSIEKNLIIDFYVNVNIFIDYSCVVICLIRDNDLLNDNNKSAFITFKYYLERYICLYETNDNIRYKNDYLEIGELNS
jgi:hypothetical protein